MFKYLRLLSGKFKAKNANIKIGVDFWASGSEATYMQALIDNGFGDALLLQSSMPHLFGRGKRESMHEEARKRNLKLGVWGWYTAEMESDQRPSMHVNAKVLSDFYRSVKGGAAQVHPLAYWSEMEAYHLNNIFTMYAASQLLWNPDRDPDGTLKEIADGLYGPRNGAMVLEALKLIEDARSGATWGTYWWTLPGSGLERPMRRRTFAAPTPPSRTSTPFRSTSASSPSSRCPSRRRPSSS